MNTTRIYIKSLVLQNIRTFGEEAVLRLDKEDGTIPQWTLILGDNGMGKSTLLQCIAWMKPYLPYETEDTFIPQPIINDEENETLENLVRRKNAPAKEEQGCIKALFVANKSLNQKKSSKTESTCETTMTIGLLDNGKLKRVEPELNTEDYDLFYRDEVIIYAYSASRQLGKLNTGEPELFDTIPSFIKEKTELYDAEEILHTSSYAALGSTGKENTDHLEFIKKIKKMLVSVLPDVDKIRDLDILSPILVGPKKRKGGIVITTKHGEKIPFSNMSLGYKTVISWTIDLAWRLLKKYPESKNPLAEPAIVLIDEIDLHLHPSWQRQIMDNLSKHFKNTQFIATAHSPLMVQAAMESNYAVLKKCENGVTILNDPAGIDGWRVDQILTSEMFGLKSARGIKYEELYSRHEELTNKKSPNIDEKVELKTISEKLFNLPSGESPEEIENRKLISKIVSNLKKSKKKIEL